ncbi:hypothetical protein Tco_0017648 [Tanacetum coccineum]
MCLGTPVISAGFQGNLAITNIIVDSLNMFSQVNKVQVMGTLGGRLLNNTPRTSYSVVAHFEGVTDWNLEPRLAMSSDNASFAVTYTSISSDSNGISWSIPLVNSCELLEMDPYEEVAQQGQAPPLSPAYVPNPIELDEHVPVYVPKPEHPEYHVSTDDDIQVEDQPYADDALPTAESPGHIANSESMKEDSIDYSDEPEDDDEDLEEDPEEDHTDDLADGEDGDDEPFDDDEDNDTDDEDEESIEDEEEEEHIALADSSAVPVTRLRRARKTVKLKPPISASMEERIVEHVAEHIPPTSSAYDQAPLGHREAMIRMRDDIPKEDMPPRRRWRFVLTAPPPGCDVAESSAAAAAARPPRTSPRVADTAEDVGYVRALQASEHRMMTSIKEVNLRISYQAHVHRQESEDFYTQLHDARTDRKAYLSSEARNRALLARLETLETHMSRMEWQRQRAKDDAVRQMMRTHVLEARAHIDTMEETGSSC